MWSPGRVCTAGKEVSRTEGNKKRGRQDAGRTQEASDMLWAMKMGKEEEGRKRRRRRRRRGRSNRCEIRNF